MDNHFSTISGDQELKIPLLKRLFDIVFSFVVIIITLPIFIFTYLIYKIEGLFFPISRGTLFYKEKRISQGQPFTLRKFRIFKQSVIDQVLKEQGFIHTKPLEKNLDNLTGTGRLLKKFYLDELPQIFSVLTGQMSLVGPRPWNPVDYQNEINKGIYRKKIIKAGLTGLVQISKGQNGDHKNGVSLDNQYINFCQENCSGEILLLDLKIIGKSLIVLLKGQGL